MNGGEAIVSILKAEGVEFSRPRRWRYRRSLTELLKNRVTVIVKGPQGRGNLARRR